MPPQEAIPRTRIYALQLLMRWILLLIIIITAISGIGTAAAAAYGTSARGCPAGSFTPNIAASREEAELKVLVPNITSLRQFVNCSDPQNVRGFCIDVFEKALSILPAPNISIHYTCFNFSSSPGASGPTYNDMVEFVANGTFDAVVGDVTIGAQRLSRVDFSHKYMESGVVILSKVTQDEVPPWLFFGWPFSLRMWCTIVGAFILTAVLICYLERNDHPEFSQGSISHRLSSTIWFTMEALVLLERESLKSSVARGLMLGWLFFVLLLNASYTAGLSSYLTVNNLTPTSQDLLSLKDSGHMIGYRRGSIIKDYLTLRFHIPEEKLVPIRKVPDFVSNLTKGPRNGGVAAIVDELPYANIILSTLSSSNCDFAIDGQQLTQEGFGFGFNKERDLEAAFSIALMNLTESGCLQELHDIDGMSDTSKCSESDAPSSKVTWKNSFTLFIPLLGSLLICMLVNYAKRYFRSQKAHLDEGPRVVDDVTLHHIYPELTHRIQHTEIELGQFPYYL